MQPAFPHKLGFTTKCEAYHVLRVHLTENIFQTRSKTWTDNIIYILRKNFKVYFESPIAKPEGGAKQRI